MPAINASKTAVSIILILIGMSYFIIIIYVRDWVIKRLKPFITIGILLSLCSLLETFVLKVISTGILILNGPLITLIIYWLIYKLYHKIYKSELASPMDCFYGKEMTFTIDSLFTLIFILLSIFLIPTIGRLG